jgi:transaldolase
MLPQKRTTKILLDGGDPEETRKIKSLLGSLDGQTVNPSLISKGQRIQRQIASARKFNLKQFKEEYKAIVQEISPLVDEAGVSIEVFANLRTTSSEMVAQGREMFSWIPNAHIKYPCTYEGLRAAQHSVEQGIRVSIGLCFSQEQAAGVYAATQTSEAPAYVCPYIGRLDDSGVNGVELIRNIRRMYEDGDGHVSVLAASVRSLNRLLACLALGVDMVTVPGRVLESWAAQGSPVPDPDFIYNGKPRPKPLKSISFRPLNLYKPWNAFNLRHDLTRKGIEKSATDLENVIRSHEEAPEHIEAELLPS